MQKLGLFVLTPIISFLGGFYAYVWVLKQQWNQDIGNDATAVLIYGGMAFVALAMPLYFLVIGFIDKRIARFKMVLYSLFCMLLFFLPTVLIIDGLGRGRSVCSGSPLVSQLLFHVRFPFRFTELVF